jgi:3-deoxy-D-manno-octulosonate 8-phosphate phosphatase (KDO 8-P phosphatase)
MSHTFSTLVTNSLERFPQAIERAATIKLLVLDVDGVLTDGSLYIGADGKEFLKTFDSLDGHGIKLLQSTGVEVAIITGRNSPMVTGRASELGIHTVHMGVKNKLETLQALLSKLNLNLNQVGAIGDDWPDLAVLNQVGFAACPAQAHAEIKNIAHYVSAKNGGQGAVREICDLILKAQGHYERLLAQALK